MCPSLGASSKTASKTERDRDLTRRCIVEKWALLVKSPQGKHEPDCPLCEAYPGCSGCPIYEKTGWGQCSGTPYRVWSHTSSEKRTLAQAQDMTGWLWALYDELTEKMLVERGGPVQPCPTCGKSTLSIASKGGVKVCDACLHEYDADGHYLVPVVRGGPWKYDGTAWERQINGRDCGTQSRGYRVRGGKVQYRREFSDIWVDCKHPVMDAGPGTVFMAPRDCDVALPEGCRWAEGSEPKPRPKDTSPFRVHDRVLFTCEHSEYTGESGIVMGFEEHPESQRVRVQPASSELAARLWEPSDLQLVCRGSDGRDALAQVAVLRGRVAELARILKAKWGGFTDLTALDALEDKLRETGREAK